MSTFFQDSVCQLKTLNVASGIFRERKSIPTMAIFPYFEMLFSIDCNATEFVKKRFHLWYAFCVIVCFNWCTVCLHLCSLVNIRASNCVVMFVSRCGMAGIESSAYLVTVCVYVWYVDNFFPSVSQRCMY